MFQKNKHLSKYAFLGGGVGMRGLLWQSDLDSLIFSCPLIFLESSKSTLFIIE